MSAFCVYGVSMRNCLEKAREELEKNRGIPANEWNAKVSKRAEELFNLFRVKQISPAFDAPEFCRDWIAVGEKTKQIKWPTIMCKGPKLDAKGEPMLRKGGRPLIGWIPFSQKVDT